MHFGNALTVVDVQTIALWNPALVPLADPTDFTNSIYMSNLTTELYRQHRNGSAVHALHRKGHLVLRGTGSNDV